MILSARDISQQLAARVESYVSWLLPNGVKEFGNWRVGSVNGEAGSSLGVQLVGPNAGIWADFAGDGRGDLLTLTSAVKGVSLSEAIKAAKEWLGIRDPQSRVPEKSYAKPKPKGVKALSDSSPVFNYLADQRGIDFITQSDFKISESVHHEHGPEVVFPYIGPSGECVNVKRIAVKRTENGKKICRQESGCAPSLFGWQALPPDCREVIITEGEIDAMTWHQLGYHALSIPDGAKGDTWIEYEWDHLQQFDTIWLNWDGDKDGQSAVRNFARRLGLARCLVLTIPGHKDANEALQAGLDANGFASAIAAAKPMAPEQIKTPRSFLDRVVEKFYPPDGQPPGFYSDIFDGLLGMRPGEITIWTGVAGHGKSALLNQIMLEATHVNNRVAIASMEMMGEQTLHRMILQSERANTPTVEQIGEILDWMGGKLWIYDVMGNTPPKLLLELMEYSCARHGVEIFVIDSLMKCSVASDDYDAQRTFLNDLCSFAKEFRVHINLVAHARKGKDESEMPGKLDVLGSSSIINQADNLLTVWRNKDKEAKSYEGISSDKEPDSIVFCTKQRETGEEFRMTYRYLKSVFRFKKMRDEHCQNLEILSRIHPPQPDLPVEEPEIFETAEPQPQDQENATD